MKMLAGKGLPVWRNRSVLLWTWHHHFSRVVRRKCVSSLHPLIMFRIYRQWWPVLPTHFASVEDLVFLSNINNRHTFLTACFKNAGMCSKGSMLRNYCNKKKSCDDAYQTSECKCLGASNIYNTAAPLCVVSCCAGFQMYASLNCCLTRAALGSPAEPPSLGGGVNITPPALTHEPAAVARLGRRQSKVLNEYFSMEF